MTPYDYGSVMHYANNSFAVNISGPTIVPVFNSSAVLGQRIQLSPIDVLEIQRYYGCVLTPLDPSATTTSRTTSSANRCSLQSSWTMSLISILSLLHVSKSTHSSAVHHWASRNRCFSYHFMSSEWKIESSGWSNISSYEFQKANPLITSLKSPGRLLSIIPGASIYALRLSHSRCFLRERK